MKQKFKRVKEEKIIKIIQNDIKEEIEKQIDDFYNSTIRNFGYLSNNRYVQLKI